MIPIRDNNPTVRPPIVTVGLIAACVLVFLWQATLAGEAGARAAFGLGTIPAVLFQTRSLPPAIELIAPELTLITSLFLHGGLMHLGFNMLYLWIFGNNIEDTLGHVRFVLFYLVCGVGATLAHAISDPTSEIPVIGASGAISGVLGAYLLLFPHARVTVVLPFLLVWPVFHLPAGIVLGIWFVMQLLSGLAGPAEGVAWWAHIGGFVLGMALLFVFRPARTPLFRRRRGPWG